MGGNAEAELFDVLEDFRFKDGRAFDFRVSVDLPFAEPASLKTGSD